MVEPISPKDVKHEIPDLVIEAFNKKIIEKWDGEQAYLTKEEMVNYICQTYQISEDELYAKHWLDVEPLYRKKGWKVKYDQPSYVETFEAYYLFEK